MPRVLILATALDGTLARSALELLGGAGALAASGGMDVAAALVGPTGLDDATRTLQRHGAGRVYRAAHAALTPGQTDAVLAALETIVSRAEPDVILMNADTVGRELAPRFAFRRGGALVTEAMELAVDGPAIVAKRQVYGGRAMATLAVTKRPAVISVKPHSFDIPEPRDAPARAEAGLEEVPVQIEAGALPTIVKEVATEKAEVGLEEAQVVIGGGRGLGGAEGFKMLAELAGVLDGAVGSSRPPADEGWVPIGWQIGQTGKTIRPALYIAVGISGAAQHVAGVSGSRTIVAINRDNQAPIFSLAHLGLVGDYRQVVPALIAKIKELKS